MVKGYKKGIEKSLNTRGVNGKKENEMIGWWNNKINETILTIKINN